MFEYIQNIQQLFGIVLNHFNNSLTYILKVFKRETMPPTKTLLDKEKLDCEVMLHPIQNVTRVVIPKILECPCLTPTYDQYTNIDAIYREGEREREYDFRALPVFFPLRKYRNPSISETSRFPITSPAQRSKAAGSRPFRWSTVTPVDVTF